MHALLTISVFCLALLSGGLLIALLRAHRTLRVLADQLTVASEQQLSDRRQLSARSELDTLKER